MLFDLLAVLLIFTSVSAQALEQLPAGWPPAAIKVPTAVAASPACCTFAMQEAPESSGPTFLLVKTHLALLWLPAGNYIFTGHHNFLLTDGAFALLERSPGRLVLFW